MKKIYLLLFLMSFSGFSQYTIDFDNFTLGDVSPQSGFIEEWPANGVTDAQVTDEEAFSMPHSIVLREQPGNNTFDDIIMLLGDKTSGTWTIDWQMLVPIDKTGYWNIQESEVAGIQWNADFYVGATGSGGSAGTITHDQTGTLVDYPAGSWFPVVMEVDLDNSTISVEIAGAPMLVNENYPGTALGSVNFFSIDANNRYYVDNFRYTQGTLSSNDFDLLELSVYPNPVVNQLNIEALQKIDEVNIFNLLGQKISSVSPKNQTAKIDFSNMSRGTYLVEITIGNQKTVKKIIK